MVFIGHGFTSGGQESGSVFSAAVCKMQASKRCIESLPLVLKNKRSCFLIARLPSGSIGRLIGIWKSCRTVYIYI